MTFSRAEKRVGDDGRDEVEDAIEQLLSLHTTRSMSMSVTRQGSRGVALNGPGGVRPGPTSPMLPTTSPSRTPPASGTGMYAAAPGASDRGLGPTSGAQKGLGLGNLPLNLPSGGAAGGSTQHDALEVSRRTLSLTPFKGRRRASTLALELASANGAGGFGGYGIGGGSAAASPHIGPGSPLFGAASSHALFRRGGGGGGDGGGAGGGGSSGPSTGRVTGSRGGEWHNFYSYGQVPDSALAPASPRSPLPPNRTSAAATSASQQSPSPIRRAEPSSTAMAAAGSSNGWNVPRHVSAGDGATAGGRELAMASGSVVAADAYGGGGSAAGDAALLATSSAGGLAGLESQSPSGTASGGGAHSPGVSTSGTGGRHRQQQQLQVPLQQTSSVDAPGPSSLLGSRSHARKAFARARGSVPGSFGVTSLAASGGSLDSVSFHVDATSAAGAAVTVILGPPQAEQNQAQHAGQHASGLVAGASADVPMLPSLNILVAQQMQLQHHDPHRAGAGAVAVASRAPVSPGPQSNNTTGGPGGGTRPSGGSGGTGPGGAGQAPNSFNFYGSSMPLMPPAPTSSYANSHSRVSQVSVGASAYSSTGLPHYINATAVAPSTTPTATGAAAVAAAGHMLLVQASGASATVARATEASEGATAAAAAAAAVAAAGQQQQQQQQPASPTSAQPGAVQQAYVTRGPFSGGSLHGGSVFYGAGAGARGGAAGGATSSVRNSSSVHGGGAYLTTTGGSNVMTSGGGLLYAGASMAGNLLYTTSGAAAGPAYVTHAVRTSTHNCRAPSIGGNSISSAATTMAHHRAGAAGGGHMGGGLDGMLLQPPRPPGPATTVGRTTATTGGGRATAMRAGIITCNPALLEDGASLYGSGGGRAGGGGGADVGSAGGGGAAGLFGRSEAAVSLSTVTTKSHQFRPTRIAGPAMKAFHLAWAALLLTFVSSFAPAALSPIIAADLHLSKPVLAVAGAMSLLSSFVTRVLMGGWVRRYGPRYCQAVALLLTAPALACTSLVRNAAGFVAARAAIGTGLATFVSSNFWVVLMFDSSVLGAAAATCTSWGNAGSGVSLLLMPLLYQAMLKVYNGDVGSAWSAVFYFPAGAHLLLGALTLLFGQDTALGDFLDFDSASDDLPGGAMLAAAGGGSYHNPKAFKTAEPDVAPATPPAQLQARRRQKQQPAQSPQLLLPTKQFSAPPQVEPQPPAALRSEAAVGPSMPLPQPQQCAAAQPIIAPVRSAAAATATGGVATAGTGHGTKRGSSSSGAPERGSGGARMAAAAAAAGVSGAQPIPGCGHGRGPGGLEDEDPSMHDLPQRLPSASLRGWRAASARQMSLRRLDAGGGACGGGGAAGTSFLQQARGPPRVSQRELPPPAASAYDEDDVMFDDGEPIFLLAGMDTGGGMPERIEEHSETLACASGSTGRNAAAGDGSPQQQACGAGSSSAQHAGAYGHGAPEGRRATGSAAGPVAEGLEEPAAGAVDEPDAPEATLEIELLPADNTAAGDDEAGAHDEREAGGGGAASSEAASSQQPAKTSACFPPPHLQVPPSPVAALTAAFVAGGIASPFRTAAAAHGEPGKVGSSVPPAAPFRTAVTIPVQSRAGAVAGTSRPRGTEADIRRRQSTSHSGAAAPYSAGGPSPAAALAAAATRGALGAVAGTAAGGVHATAPGGGGLPTAAGSFTPAAVAATTAEGVPPASSGAVGGAHAAYLNLVRGRLSQGGAIKAAAAAAAAATGNNAGKSRGQQHQGLLAGAAAAPGASPVTHVGPGGGTDDPSHHPRWSNNNAPAGGLSGDQQQLGSAPQAVKAGGSAVREGAQSLLPAPRPPKHHHALGLGLHEAYQLYSMACRNYRCLLLALNYGYNFGAQLALYNVLSIYLYERYGMSLLGAGALAAMPGLLNVFSRVSGSLLSGLVCRHFGMRGRLWLLWVTQTAGGLCCVGLGLCGGGQAGLGATGVLLLLFGLCTQIAAGTTSTVLPYVSFRAFAAVLGVTSAGGQLGGVVLLLAFFVTTSLSYQQGILWMGVAIIVISLSVAAIRFPMWGGMLAGPDTRYGGVQEEQYYISEWTAEEQARGDALPALMFALHARSERSGWDYFIEKRSLARV